MKRSPALLFGASLLSVMVLLAALAPLVAPHDPLAANEAVRFSGPSAEYPFGTDHLGRCVFCRSLHGARISLLLSLSIVVGGGILGTVLGAAAGYAGGASDLLFGAVVDLLLALPRLVLALVAVGLAGPSVGILVLVLVLVDWTGYARVARGIVLKEKVLPYVLAERAIGFSRLRILFRSLLPATVPSATVYAVLRMGGVLLTIAGLGFLGLGIPPPMPEWGTMIGEGRIYLRSAPWIVLFPSLLIVMTVLGFGLLSEGLRTRVGVRLFARTVR